MFGYLPGIRKWQHYNRFPMVVRLLHSVKLRGASGFTVGTCQSTGPLLKGIRFEFLSFIRRG